MKFFLSTFLTMVLLVSSCFAEKIALSKNQKTWTQGNVSVIAYLENSEFAENKPINLKIKVLNSSTESIRIFLTNPLNNLIFTVVNKNSNSIVPINKLGEKYQKQIYFRNAAIEIKVNNNYTYDYNLRDYFDLSSGAEYAVSVTGEFYNKTSRIFITYNIEGLTFAIKK